MAQILQKYRDYKLTIKNPTTGDELVVENDNFNGKGLRISFLVRTIAPLNLTNRVSGNVCQFSIKIYNLSPTNQKKINDGKFTQVFLSAGYRELENSGDTGNKSTQPILVNGTVYNSFSYRESSTDMITELKGLKDANILNNPIDKADECIYSKDLLIAKNLSRQDIFLAFLNKYFKNSGIKIDQQSLSGFDEVYNVLDPTQMGFTFDKGTTVAEALGKIAGERLWYIDNINRLNVIAKPTREEKVKPIFASFPSIDVNQKTGLLDIPILSPIKRISVKSLLNPLISPTRVVKISTRDGFRQQSILRPADINSDKKETTYSEREYTAVVMTANFRGDSRSGQWVTEFETYGVDSVTIEGEN